MKFDVIVHLLIKILTLFFPDINLKVRHRKRNQTFKSRYNQYLNNYLPINPLDSKLTVFDIFLNFGALLVVYIRQLRHISCKNFFESPQSGFLYGSQMGILKCTVSKIRTTSQTLVQYKFFGNWIS